jgi:hypothetical protein
MLKIGLIGFAAIISFMILLVSIIAAAHERNLPFLILGIATIFGLIMTIF